MSTFFLKKKALADKQKNNSNFLVKIFFGTLGIIHQLGTCFGLIFCFLLFKFSPLHPLRHEWKVICKWEKQAPNIFSTEHSSL